MTSAKSNQVRVGVIGLGFMGATHIAAYQSAAAAGYPCQLVAVCDPKPSRRAGRLWDVGGNAVSDTSSKKLAFDPKIVRAYERAEQLLGDESIDLISICTRTDTHVDLAIRALRAAKHVLVEKPVALQPGEIARLHQVHQETGKLCMPAMCLRFWPAWRWLKERIDDQQFGQCLSLTLTRLASQPTWSAFYSDGAKNGGAIVDLHIHDADYVRFCLGDPSSVSSSGVIGRTGAIDHVTTIYHHPGKRRHVVAEGGWDQHDGFAYRMRYVAVFERATADYELSSSERLLLCRDGRAEPVELEKSNGYEGEVRHIVRAIAEGARQTDVTLADALTVIELIDAERRSVLEAKTLTFSRESDE
jgi:predicted dehydrogenase